MTSTSNHELVTNPAIRHIRRRHPFGKTLELNQRAESIPEGGERKSTTHPDATARSVESAEWIDARMVEAIVGLSRRSIDRLEAKGCFPQRIRLGYRTVRWVRIEIEQWMRAREDERRM